MRPPRIQDCTDYEKLPCGCKVGTKVIDGERCFLLEPCSLDCEFYVYAMKESDRQGKKRETVMKEGVH